MLLQQKTIPGGSMLFWNLTNKAKGMAQSGQVEEDIYSNSFPQLFHQLFRSGTYILID